MFRDNCFFFGYFLKTHGIHGGLVLKVENDLVDILDEMESLFVEIDKQLIPFSILSVKIISDNSAIVCFTELQDETLAKEFCNYKVFAENKWEVESVELGKQIYSCIGFLIIDKTIGRIGEIINIHQYSTNIVIETQYLGKELLIPVSDEIVINVDTNNSCVMVNLPDGLVDIYLGS